MRLKLYKRTEVKITTSVNIYPTTLARLKDIASTEGWKLGEIVVSALNTFVEEYDRQNPPQQKEETA